MQLPLSINSDTAWRHYMWFAVLVSGIPMLAPASLMSFVGLVTHSEYYSHIAVIPIVALYLIYTKRAETFANLSYFPSILPLLVLTGVSMAILERIPPGSISPATSLALLVLAAILYVVAAFVFCLGQQAFKNSRFALLFLLLMVPVPQSVLDPAIVTLQRGSTEVASSLFYVMGIPFVREGFTLTFPSLTIEVARECSSIRSSTVMVVMLILMGKLFLRSYWARLLLLLGAPIAILTNGIRIATLVMLSIYVNPRILDSSLHHRGGTVFFLLGLLIMALFVKLLRRLEQARLGPLPSEPS